MSKYVGGSVSAKVELDITEFRKTLETLKKDVEILKKGLSNFGTKQTGIEKEVGKLRTEMEKLQRVNKTLSESNKSIKDDSRRIRDEFKKQSESYSMAKEALNKFVSENNKLSESLAKVEKENGRLNRKVDAAVDLWREADHQVRKLSNENDKLSSSMEKLKNENTKLNSELSKTSESLAKAESKYETAAAENKKLADSMNKLKGESKQLKTELANQNNTIAKDTKKVADAQTKEVEVLKKTELQAKKTGAALKQAFTNDLYNSILKNKGSTNQVPLRPVYDELKNKYKSLVKNRQEFEKLFAHGLRATKTRLYTTRDPEKFVKFGKGVNARNFGNINIASLKKPFQEAQKEAAKTEEVVKKTMSDSANSTKKLENEVEKLSSKFKSLSSSTGRKHSLKEITNLGWETTNSQLSKAGQALSVFDEKLKKTASTSKQTSKQISSNFNQLEKDFTLSLLRNVKQMESNGQVPLADVMQKLKMEYMSTITSWENFEKKFLKSMKVIGAEFGRVGLGGNSTVRFSHTDRGFDILKTDNLKGLREIKAELEGVRQEATQVESNIKASMEGTSKSVEQTATSLKKETEAIKSENQATNEAVKQNDKLISSEKKLQSELSKSAQVQAKRVKYTGMSDNIGASSKSMDSYNKKVDIVRTKLSQVKRALEEYLNTWAKSNIQVNRSSTEISNAINKFAARGKKVAETTNETEKFVKAWDKAKIEVKRDATEIANAINQFASAGKKINSINIGKNYSNNWELTAKQLTNASKALSIFDRGLNTTAVNYRKLASAAKPFDVTLDQMRTAFMGLETPVGYLDRMAGAIRPVGAAFKDFFASTRQSAEAYKQRLSVIADELKAKWHAMSVELAQASAATYKYWKQVRGTADVKGYNNLGTLDVGINQYYGQIDKINAKLAEFKAQQQSVNTNISQTYNEFSKASQGLALLNTQLERYTALINQNSSTQTTLGNRIRTVQAEITSLSNASSKNAIMLTNQGRQAQSLGTRLTNLNNKLRQGKVSNEQYRAELDKLENELKQLKTSLNSVKSTLDSSNTSYSKANAQIKRLAEGYKQNEQAAKQSSVGMKQAGNSMQQTAHSGRILSNTLYQIRGALLSLKMIFTAMGGMALWGFATEIAEGIKTTFTAKNEMEEQLKANTKVGASGLQVFNRELDNTISRFKKINKYALGETVSAIGLEFELNTKQMAESMDIVAMLQSEYVRAGRTQEEAALAVKDILQGEFQRLSRETGVGKEELLSYGWSGDVKDVNSILKAVKKAGEDRNWDLFAAKATSLNDVIQITKSRFEEFGADFLQTISPAIVSGFNMLVDSLTGLQKAFNGLGTGARNTLVAGSFLGGITAIATAIPMVTKGMGLADIATIGWGKSLATAALNLNKTTVAQRGFRKALAEVITGTKASDLANVRSSKAIMGRLLGVKQSVLAEHGYMTALVQSRGVLMNHTGATNIAKINSMSLAQKVAYLTGNMKLQKAQSLSTSQAILKTATSWKVLRTAMLGVIGIAAIAWYSSMATWADTVRKNIEGLNEVIDNGDSMLKEAKSTVSDYETALSKLTKGTNEYKKAANNLEVAKANEKDIATANKLAKVYKKQNEQAEKNIATQHKLQMARSYELAGIDPTKASEMASGWTERVKAGEQNWIDSMNIYDDRLYKASQHINEHIDLMNKAGLSEEQRVKYITEYSMKAEEVAENWKKFNQGDMTAGAYALLGELQLQWIDLWNNDHFLNFWNSVKDTWEDLKPTIYAIKDALMDLGNVMLDFFSTKHGQILGGIVLFGTAIGLVGLKIGKWVTGAKTSFEVLKKWGGALKDRIKDWKDLRDKVEEANEKMGGDKSTGGIKGEKADSWFNKSQIQGDVQKYTRAAVAIAAGMALITEAIVLLNAPMLALAGTGMVFEHLEPQIRSGIKGLQLIAPTVMALLPPVIALCYVFAKFNVESSTIISGAKTAAIGIAAGMLLVAEAVVMLVAPMLAIAALGYVNGLLGDGLQQGKQAITLMGEAVMAMAPVIPVFAAALIMGAIAVATGGTGFVAEAAAIAAGMLLVSEAILSLAMPMAAIAALGYISVNLGGMQQGAEAIKQTAEALKYVSEAMGYLAAVAWENLSYNIATVLNHLTGHDLGSDLQKLTEENGVIDQLNKFTIEFNQHTIEPIQEDKVTNLKNAATGITTIGDAMQAVKTAMDNLPQEFKNGAAASGTPAENYAYNTQTDAATATTDATGYFEQFKQPLKELKNFIYEFNHSDDFAIEQIDTGRVAAINSAADMIVQVQSAVDKVKATMGMVVDAGWNQNMATGGIFAAVSGYLGGLTAGTTGGSAGAEGYSSSLGSSLKEMENVIKDLVTFNNNVNSILGSGEGDSSAAGSTATAMANMVTAVDQAIQHLSETLSNAVPTIKGNATAIGQGIHDGIKDGMGDLTSLILPPFQAAMQKVKDNAGTYGKGAGWKLTHGFDSELKLKEATEAEVNYTMQYLDGKKPDFYNKGAELGDELSKGYKEHGLQQQSPGLMARTTLQEMYYMQDSLDVGMSMLPQKAVELGNALTSNFNPQLGLGGLSVDDLSQFQTGLNQISTMANTTNMQTSAAFTNMNMNTSTNMMGMTSTVNGAFNNIQQNTTTKYNQIVNTTRTSLTNMQSQTTRNINAIKTSWRGMQTALIASAEHIRSETGSKIKSLEHNMGSFWHKVQNPALLLAGGTESQSRHTTPRRSGNRFRSSAAPRRLMAGSPSIGGKVTGISSRFKQSKIANSKNFGIRDAVSEYLRCLLTDGVCMAGGGWGFNWSPEIRNALLKWNTHFQKYSIDDYVTVGKFENDDFPVKGIAGIAKEYIKDAISRTSYEHYFNQKYGSPLEAWNAGHFNCVDGARVVIALANAFGFGGGSIRYTTWDGEGHGYAYIPGLGNIDATAIQGGYGLTASKVRYSGSTSINRSSAKSEPQIGNQFGDVVFNVTINGNVDNAEETGKQIADEAGKRFIDMFRRSPATGL